MAKKTAPRGYSKGNWSESSLKLMNERYLAKDKAGNLAETPEGMIYRVAKKFADEEKNLGLSDKEIEALTREYYQIMIDKRFIPNSPTLMNAGRDNHLQYAGCFVIPVGDSIEEIFDAIKYAAMIHKSGGGTGFSFSRLRSKGSIVCSTTGVASGPVSFMRVFDSATNEVKQGGTRRGANMGILRVDHPDILEFIESKASGGITNFNISVAATDVFMKAVKANREYALIEPKNKKKVGKLKAKEVFDKIAFQAWKTGDPGFIFIDRINAGSANPVPEMGPIEATNPCVVGSTLISTERGLVKIEDLVSQKMSVKIVTDDRVLKNKGLTARSLTKYIDNGEKDVWRLQTKSGYELVATPDHKVLTTRGWVPLEQLQINKDKVLIQSGEGRFNNDFNLPIFITKGKSEQKLKLPTKWSKELGQVLGWLVGDGWLRQGDKNCRVGFSFGKDDEKILSYFKPILNNWYTSEIKPIKRENNVWHLSYHQKNFVDFFVDLGVKPVKAEKKEVPEAIFTAPREAVIGFLQGLFSADGTVNFLKDRNSYVRLTSKSKKLLYQVQILLANLGIMGQIYNRSRKAREMFPYRNKEGQQVKYLCDGVCFELAVSRQPVMLFLKEIGFLENKHQEKIHQFFQKNFYSREFTDLICKLEPAGKEKVFDLTEPVTYSMIANGIVVADCGEQPLYPNEACNLGSINLVAFINTNKKDGIDWDKLGKTTHLAIRFLDDVVEANPVPLEEISKTVKLNRRIGLGVMGWADVLFKLEIPYDSKKATSLGRKIMEFIQLQSHQASEELAKNRGPFPNFEKSIYKDGVPLRNATTTTIAPTGSISIITDCSSGIEPIFALCFKHKSGDRELTFINPYFQKVAKKLNLSNEIWQKIESQGTLHDIPEIPEKIRKIFVTAHEIRWKDHIDMQAAFQTGTDNAVSKTINLPGNATVEQVKEAYLYAYQSGCLGITVFRDGCKSEQVLYSGVNGQKKEDEPKVMPLTIKPRPKVVSGQTYRVETPVGTAFVTVNINGDSEPLEVFVTVGKAGSAVSADAEALGRLISLNIRIGSIFSAKEVLAMIIDQLDGIGGGESIGFGKDRVRSLADGIAQVLKEYSHKKNNLPAPEATGVDLESQQPNLLLQAKRRDLCPSCGRATLIFEEGCTKCLYCGYNKC